MMLFIERHSGRRWLRCRLAIAYFFSVATAAFAGNGANFVAYDHHTGEKGETEIKAYNDLSRLAEDGTRYTAQLLEFEHALTDQWIVAAYLESHKENGEDYSFDGFRLETRYRLFDYGTPFNPVLYAEYVNKKVGSLLLREAVGRTDGEAGEEENENAREHELETKLILGHDVNDRLRLGFNWINEVNLKSGDWAFGYAAGLTYTLFEVESRPAAPAGGLPSGRTSTKEISRTQRESWSVKEVQLGAELFGGLGDSVKGLTLDGSKTEQYLGINLKTEFSNGAMFQLGGAFGLTADSEDALFRAMIGWEFD